MIYTYDKNTDTVTIHGGNISITPRQPEKLGGGFWDALFFVKPGTQITAPNEYFNPNAPGATGDADGINGNVIWDRTGNGNGNVFAGVITNNRTLESVVKYNQIPTYTISRDADGTFHVFDVWGRLNNIDNENLMHGSYYHYPEGLSISIPQRSASSVSYHYNVSSVPVPLPLSAKRLIQVSFANSRYYRSKNQLKKPDTSLYRALFDLISFHAWT